MFSNSTKLGTLRLLPKLHKDKFSCRTIINCRNHPTSTLSLLINIILQPLVQSRNSYIKDSQQLLQDSLDLQLTQDTQLYSCDFESLYTNIPLDYLLNDISSFMSTHLNSKHLSITGFNKILSLILHNNIFTFKDHFYIQIKGIAMGTICGPTLANLYLSLKEDLWLSIIRPLYYKRFIDDIFLANENDIDFPFFSSFFHGLHINYEKGKKVHFLDLNLELNEISNSLSTSLYIKKTNTFSYLLCSSNHPANMKKNIPKSLFIRIRRICSSFSDYLYFSYILIKQLISRGYEKDYLIKVCYAIGKEDRSLLLPYKFKNKQESYKFLILPLKYEESIKNLHSLYYDTYINFTLTLPYFQNLKPLKIVNAVNLNLKDYFIFNKSISSYSMNKNKKCNNLSCTICPFLNTSFSIFLNKSFQLPIMCNANCQDKSCIYIIHCKFCNIYYIGQTGRTAHERIREHIYCIKNKKILSEVAVHFNQDHHELNKHFEFFIFKSNILSKCIRYYIENDLINIFKFLTGKVINDFIPYISLMKKTVTFI